MTGHQLNTKPDSRQTEWKALNLLLDQQRPSSLEELGRELDDPIAAIDAIANLRAAGLAHRSSEGFVFATRAAVYFNAIAQ
jgi:predicted transcriptional regulator